MTTDTLMRLWKSTSDLYERFGLDADSVPPAQRRRFLNEEVLELMEASIAWEVSLDASDMQIMLEAADVLVTVCGLLQAHRITMKQFEIACAAVAAKNDAKTEANGYRLTDGKIRKVEGSAS